MQKEKNIMETKTINIQFQRFLQTWICSRSVDFWSSSWNVLCWVADDLLGLGMLWWRWDPRSETAQAWVWFYTKTKEREGSGEKITRDKGKRKWVCATVIIHEFLSSQIKNLNLYRLVSFLKIKHTHIKHTIMIFHTLKHIVWKMEPNTFFALWIL